MAPHRTVEEETRQLVSAIPLAVLLQVAEWLGEVPLEKRLSTGDDARRETVIPMSIGTARKLQAHVDVLSPRVCDWFDQEALGKMAPKAQNAWFYSFSSIYSDAFKKWINKAVHLIETHAESCVFYVAPVSLKSSGHKKRSSTVQPIRMPDGRIGAVGLPKERIGSKGVPKERQCVKCNRKMHDPLVPLAEGRAGRDLYFHACECFYHYADRCLRCKVIQWALEGAFHTRLKGRAAMISDMKDLGTFPGHGKCTSGCGASFMLNDLICVHMSARDAGKGKGEI